MHLENKNQLTKICIKVLAMTFLKHFEDYHQLFILMSFQTCMQHTQKI